MDLVAACKQFQGLVERKALETKRGAIGEMLDRMQTPIAQGGNMPVDTGRLQGSLQSYINGSLVTTGAFAHRAAIANLVLGQTFSVVRAPGVHYATAQEYGFTLPSGVWFQGRFYTTLAVRGWQGYVATEGAAAAARP